MSLHLGCSHIAGSPSRSLYLVQFSAADRQTTEDLHTSAAPGNNAQLIKVNPAIT